MLITRLPDDSWLRDEYRAAVERAKKPTVEKIRDRQAHYAALAARQAEEASE